MSSPLDRTIDNMKSFSKSFASVVILLHGTTEIFKLVMEYRKCKPWELKKKRAINETIDKIQKVMEPHRSKRSR